MTDRISIPALRERLHTEVNGIQTDEALALVEAVEAARMVAAGFGGFADDPPSMLDLRAAIARFDFGEEA